MEGGQISSEQSSSVGGGIYNEGAVTLTGTEEDPAKIINNKAYHMAAGVLNDGELTVDYATFSGNAKGDWSNSNQHVYNKDEMAGENIYAVKDVTITPNADFDGKDIRIIEKNSHEEESEKTSKILLTGPLTKQINVSISEASKKQPDATLDKIKYPIHPKFNETQNRKVGYLVAEGTGGYTPTKEDAKQIHYISKDTSPGKWDFVLDKDNDTIVLGQRVKLIYHGNLGKIGDKDSEEELVDVYKNPEFWEGEDQLKEFKAANPTRDKYSFMGWYFWKDDVNAQATNNEGSIQNIKEPDDLKNNLFDFSKVTFENNVKDTDKIITPNVINTYAGWSENIDLNVEKTWVNAEDSDKKDISVTLYDGETSKETKTFDNSTNYGGKFENLPVFTKSYEGTEEKNMNLRFTPKVYKVEEAAIEGFTTSYNPESITANSDVEKKITITNTKTKTGNVYVKYITEDGTILEAESVVKKDAPVGEEYTTTQKTFDGYEFSKMVDGSADVKGEVVAGDLHVVYVYKAKTTPDPENPNPQPDPQPNPDPQPDPENPKQDKIITRYVDEFGNDLIHKKDGDHPKEMIPGYEFIKTERSENLVSHIYRKIYRKIERDGNYVKVSTKIGIDRSKLKEPERPVLNKEDHKAYMFGYPDWIFRPDNNMTRAEATCMFARLLKNYPREDVKYNLSYPDIKEDEWYYPAIGFMTENNIIEGYEDGSFRPNNPITRAEFSKMASKFDDLVGNNTKAFADVSENHWALKYINSAYAKGWVNGYEEGSFRPDRNITRAEVVTITNKMLNRYADQDFVRANKSILIDFKDLEEAYWAYFNIMEATHGHDFVRKPNGMDELWERLNGEAFIFPKLRYNVK